MSVPKHSWTYRLTVAAALAFAFISSACSAGVIGDSERGASGAPSPTQVLPAAPTATPTLIAIPGPTASPVGAPSPTGAPAPVAECRTRPVRSFGKIYSENPNVARLVGCPLEQEKGVFVAEQFFQKGYMFWRNDTRQIYVMMNDGRWSVYSDTWNEGDPSPTSTPPPPAGLVEPVRGFGKVWREQKGVRDGLGWATERERGFDGSVQPFERGAMLLSDRRFIFVLSTDGTWLRFEDTFRG